jgi:hypothetical protein
MRRKVQNRAMDTLIQEVAPSIYRALCKTMVATAAQQLMQGPQKLVSLNWEDSFPTLDEYRKRYAQSQPQ